MFDQLEVTSALKNMIRCIETSTSPVKDISTALGEIKINGVEYQIQIVLYQDKKMWMGESDVRNFEIVKIHK